MITVTNCTAGGSININSNENDLYFKRVTALLLEGWEVTRVSCYDEEGVEGWQWLNCNEEHTELGGWNKWPALPESLYEEADRLIKEYKENK